MFFVALVSSAWRSEIEEESSKSPYGVSSNNDAAGTVAAVGAAVAEFSRKILLTDGRGVGGSREGQGVDNGEERVNCRE